MKRKIPRPPSDGNSANSMLASKYQQDLARLGNNKSLKAIPSDPGYNRNGLDSADTKADNSIQDIFIARRLANIQLILVACIALVFIAWTGVGLFEQVSTGNCSLLFGDFAPGTLFTMVVRNFLFQEK